MVNLERRVFDIKSYERVFGGKILYGNKVVVYTKPREIIDGTCSEVQLKLECDDMAKPHGGSPIPQNSET